MHLEPGRIQRRVEVLPGEDLDLRLADARESGVVHRLTRATEVDNDSVSLRLVDPEGALDQRLEWTDLEQGREGDYYYLRVTQLDGERAWSSPFWVGGVARTAEP